MFRVVALLQRLGQYAASDVPTRHARRGTCQPTTGRPVDDGCSRRERAAHETITATRLPKAMFDSLIFDMFRSSLLLPVTHRDFPGYETVGRQTDHPAERGAQLKLNADRVVLSA
jgi:hypothetical protein